jgi:hypothetical protein
VAVLVGLIVVTVVEGAGCAVFDAIAAGVTVRVADGVSVALAAGVAIGAAAAFRFTVIGARTGTKLLAHKMANMMVVTIRFISKPLLENDLST